MPVGKNVKGTHHRTIERKGNRQTAKNTNLKIQLKMLNIDSFAKTGEVPMAFSSCATIPEVDEQLVKLVQQIDPHVKVTLNAVLQEQNSPTVSLYLVGIEKSDMVDSTGRTSLFVQLKYFVTAWDRDTAGTHALLSGLLAQVSYNTELQLEFHQFKDVAWNQFQCVPQPFFIISIPLRYKKKESQTTVVDKPLVLRKAVMKETNGIVFNSKNIPVPGAIIQQTHLSLTTQTDESGRFHFPAFPVDTMNSAMLQSLFNVIINKKSIQKTIQSKLSEDGSNVFIINALEE